jgi:hypothetical protein
MSRRLKEIDPPDSEQVAAGGERGCWRRLTSAYRICILGTWWVIPAGEEWNQASVPRPLRLVIDEQELGDTATLGHDMLYRYRGALPRAWLDRSVPGATYRTYTRDEADAFLWITGMLERVPRWKGWLGHGIVRAFWWTAEALRLSPAW